MGDSADTGHISQNVPAANHRHHKWDLPSIEPYFDILNTSGYPNCHIPHKQAAKANQAQPRTPDRFDNSNSRSSNYQELLQVVLTI